MYLLGGCMGLSLRPFPYAFQASGDNPSYLSSDTSEFWLTDLHASGCYLFCLPQKPKYLVSEEVYCALGYGWSVMNVDSD